MKLTDEDRVRIAGFYTKGYNCSEIGRRLGLTREQVKWALRLARKRGLAKPHQCPTCGSYLRKPRR